METVWSLLQGKKSWRSVNVFHAECRSSVSLDLSGTRASFTERKPTRMTDERTGLPLYLSSWPSAPLTASV